jgi:hypothetical protein
MLFKVFYIWFYFLFAVNAQYIDCSYVVNLWKLWGKQTDANPTSNNECCKKIPGVGCLGGNVVSINWASQSLTGTIPDYIGNLIKVETL